MTPFVSLFPETNFFCFVNIFLLSSNKLYIWPQHGHPWPPPCHHLFPETKFFLFPQLFLFYEKTWYITPTCSPTTWFWKQIYFVSIEQLYIWPGHLVIFGHLVKLGSGIKFFVSYYEIACFLIFFCFLLLNHLFLNGFFVS